MRPTTTDTDTLSFQDLVGSLQNDLDANKIAQLIAKIEAAHTRESDTSCNLEALGQALIAKYSETTGLILIIQYACYLLPQIINVAKNSPSLKEAFVEALILQDTEHLSGLHYLVSYASNLMPSVQELVVETPLKKKFVRALVTGSEYDNTALSEIARKNAQYLTPLMDFIDSSLWFDCFENSRSRGVRRMLVTIARHAPEQFLKFISEAFQKNDPSLLDTFQLTSPKMEGWLCCQIIMIEDHPNHFLEMVKIFKKHKGVRDFSDSFIYLLLGLLTHGKASLGMAANISDILDVLINFSDDKKYLLRIYNTFFPSLVAPIASCVDRLYFVARYAPTALSTLLCKAKDSVLRERLIEVPVLSAPMLEGDSGWTVLHLLVQYVPASIKRIVEIVFNDQVSDVRKLEFIDALSRKESKNLRSVLHIIAQNSSSVLPIIIEKLKSVSRFSKSDLCNLMEDKDSNQMSVLDVFLQFSSVEDKSEMQKVFPTESKPSKTASKEMTLSSQTLLNQPSIGVSQGRLISVIINAMELLGGAPLETKKDIILNGLCFGFSVVHAYMYVIDKLEWWESVLKLISELPSDVGLSQIVEAPGVAPISYKDLLTKVINYVFFHQASPLLTDIEEIDQSKILQLREKGGWFDSKEHGGIKFYCCFAGCFVPDSLNTLLGLIEKASPLMVLIGGNGHTSSIEYDKGQWCLYDPNTPDKKIIFNNKKMLAQEILKTPNNNHKLGNKFSIQIAGFQQLKDNPQNLQPLADYESTFYAESFHSTDAFNLAMRFAPDQVRSFFEREKSNASMWRQFSGALCKTDLLMYLAHYTPDTLIELIDRSAENPVVRAVLAQGLCYEHLSWLDRSLLTQIARKKDSNTFQKILYLAEKYPEIRASFLYAIDIPASAGQTFIDYIVSLRGDFLSKIENMVVVLKNLPVDKVGVFLAKYLMLSQPFSYTFLHPALKLWQQICSLPNLFCIFMELDKPRRERFNDFVRKNLASFDWVKLLRYPWQLMAPRHKSQSNAFSVALKKFDLERRIDIVGMFIDENDDNQISHILYLCFKMYLEENNVEEFFGKVLPTVSENITCRDACKIVSRFYKFALEQDKGLKRCDAFFSNAKQRFSSFYFSKIESIVQDRPFSCYKYMPADLLIQSFVISPIEIFNDLLSKFKQKYESQLKQVDYNFFTNLLMRIEDPQKQKLVYDYFQLDIFKGVLDQVEFQRVVQQFPQILCLMGLAKESDIDALCKNRYPDDWRRCFDGYQKMKKERFALDLFFEKYDLFVEQNEGFGVMLPEFTRASINEIIKYLSDDEKDPAPSSAHFAFFSGTFSGGSISSAVRDILSIELCVPNSELVNITRASIDAVADKVIESAWRNHSPESSPILCRGI